MYRWLLIILLFIFSTVPCQARQGLEWQTLQPGLYLAQINAYTPSGSGSPELLFLRINPEDYRFQILYDPPQRLSADSWLQQSGALAVFNIGQYDHNSNYLGLLIKDGVTRSTIIGNQQGLFLAENKDNRQPRARVLDLRYSAFDAMRNPYQQVAQSLMLLDRYGQIRVRRSLKLAHRSLLGQDEHGNIIVIFSKGRHTLWELADWLKQFSWLREVMCMDGGPEAQLALNVGGYSYSWTGSPQLLPDLPWPSVGLPMALAIYSRR